MKPSRTASASTPSTLAKQEEAALALDQGADRAGVARPLEEVAFPVSRHLAPLDLDRAVVD